MKLAFFLLLCIPAACQRVTLIVNQANCKDTVGQQFAYALKEAIISSKQYVIGGDLKSGYQAILHCIDSSSVPGSEASSAISLLLTIEHPSCPGAVVVISHGIILVGQKRIDDMAKAALAGIDSNISTFWDSTTPGKK